MNQRLQLPLDKDRRIWDLAMRFAGWCLVVAILLLLACLAGHSVASAQSVLVPCYEASVATQALRQTPKGKEGSVILIMNVASGPWSKWDAGYGEAVKAARARGVRLAFYIDAMAGKDYSPVIYRNGDSYHAEPVALARDKTTLEIRNERSAWVSFYGAPNAWFIDDVRPRHTQLFAELAAWRDKIILNPGTGFVPPASLTTCIVVIHESETGWPRTVSRWEAGHWGQCAVIGLSVNAASSVVFTQSTAGVACRYASPLSDAQGAYNKLSPYFGGLFP
jgi:hypothetical protein